MVPEKIAPGLLFALEDYRAQGVDGLAQHARSLGLPSVAAVPRPQAGGFRPGPPVARLRAAASQQAPRAVVFLQFSDPKAALTPGAATDVRVNQSAGKVRTALVPLDRVAALSDDPSVQRIVPARYLRPLLDVALPRVRIPDFRTGHNLGGDGVVVGIIDSGIDPNHPAFTGRILRIWDQTVSGPGVPEGGYGAEFTGGLLSVSRDALGHGTHVAGIAAGDDPVYRGVAPKADLLVVKTDFLDAHIADAILYVFRVAGELGRPAVVNLSLGGHSDPHDGTDSLSQVIDAATGPGRIVCCAAGNEGNDHLHAQALATQELQTLPFRVPPESVGTAWLNGWYAGGARVEVAVRTPSGFVTNPQPVLATGAFERSYSLPDAEIRVATPGPDPANGDHHFLIQIRGTSQSPAVRDGVWQLRVRAASPVPSGGVTLDVWTLDAPLDPSRPGSPQVFFTGPSVQDSMKIGSPGIAESAVTVASYTTRVQWTDVDGALRTVGLTADDISDFSSPGPSRTGKQKPDVAAPGAMLVSSRSADSFPGREFVVDGRHLVMAGTSMSTPVITGLVALLLRRDPSLDPTGVKALLRGHSTIPGQAPMTFDPTWGWGLIDASGL